MNIFIKHSLGFIMAYGLMACVTPGKQTPQDGVGSPVQVEVQTGPSVAETESLSKPPHDPDRSNPDGPQAVTPPVTPPLSTLPNSPPVQDAGRFAQSNFQVTFSDYLLGWNAADLRPALMAFARNCPLWEKQAPDRLLKTSKPEFGRYGFWQDMCGVLPPSPFDKDKARWFFETHFLPMNLLTAARLDGLLTGYYEPEIEVRARLNGEFSEPILAKPQEDKLKNKTRADIYRNQVDYAALAYGRPLDVFFMQVQGSGRIRFKDGRVKRAAYGGNNGRKYKSIGGVLIRRGELTREQASKQSIEEWMTASGSTAARSLMNENPRYIYFSLEDIEQGEGPKGSLGAPLTAMGSMAIDPKSRPYGVPIWLQTTLPQFAGDYNGRPENLLVIAQDSGNAIKGQGRGDLFFGSGALAGELAGVMKHDVTMIHLLPRRLVMAQMGFR